MAYSAGTGFVQVVPSLRGFHQAIRSELAGIKDSVTVKVTPVIDEAGFKRVPRVPDQTVNVKAKVDNKSFIDAANASALFLRNLATPATFVAATAAIPTLVDFTVAAGTASQALLVLPAAGATAAAVMGTVRIATSGMSEAFKQVFAADRDPKKLAEALANLSPQARAFVTEADRIKPTLDSIRVDVQDAAFRGLSTTLSGLASVYLPVARSGFTGVAVEGNAAAIQVGAFAREAQTVSTVQDVFTATATVVRNLSPALVNVLAIIRDIVGEGTHYLPGLANGFTALTERARAFVAGARESGQLAVWMENGIRAVGLLGQTFLNVGGIITGTLRAANTDSLGFLTNVRDMTAGVREFVNSARGQEVIGQVFANLRDLASALGPLLWQIAAAGGGIGLALLPVLPDIVRLITAVLEAARPWLAAFTELAIVVLPPLVDFLTRFSDVIGFLTAAIILGVGAYKLYSATIKTIELAVKAWEIAQALLNGTLALNPIGLVVIALVALAAGLVYAWQNSETFRNIVTGAWDAVKSAFQTAWDLIQQAFAGIVQAGRDAWTWLQGIFDSIGQGAAGVGGWFTGLWHDYVEPAWNGIVTVAQWALAILLTVVFAPIQIAINVLGAVWDELKVIVSNVWTTIQEEAQIWWDFLRGIFDTVVNFLGPIFQGAWNGFRDLVVGVYNDLAARVSTWWNNEVLPVWNTIVGFLGGIFTQAFEGWRIIIVGIYDMLAGYISNWWNGIILPLWNIIINFFTVTVVNAFEQWRANVTARWDALWLSISNWWNVNVQPLINTVITFFTVTVVNAFEQWRAGVQSKWDTLWGYLQTWWNTWVQPLLNSVINFVTVTLPNGFQSGVDKIRAVWETIKAALRTPLQAAIDIVWNNGIAKVWENVRAIIPGLPGIPGVPFVLPFAAGGPVERPTLGLIGEAGPEYVMSAPAVRNLGGIDAVDTLHNAALSPRRTIRAMNSGAYVEGADHTGPGISTTGYGGVRPHVAQAGHYLGPKFGIGSIGGVGARANASDHPGGLALDFMTSGNNGTALADFLSSPANWNHFAVKYIIWRQRIRNGPGAGWTPMADRGSPTANHMDHVHVSFTGTPGQGAMDGGGGGPSILELLTNAWQTVRDAVGRLGGIAGAGSLWGQAVTGFGRKIVDSAWNYLAGRAGEMMAAAAVSAGQSGVVSGTIGGSAATRASVAGIAMRYGWDQGAEWTALQQLIQKESSWNPTAQNPTSTAYGLFQFLNGTWASVGATKTSNPGLQAEAGLRYIAQKYGTPSRALAFHNANNYYDAGGLASGRGFLAKGTIAPERVLSSRQTDAFEQLVATITRGRGTVSTDRYGRGHREGIGGAVGGDGGALIGSLTVPVPDGAGIQETLDSVFTRARHEQRRGRYSHR